MIRWCLCGV